MLLIGIAVIDSFLSFLEFIALQPAVYAKYTTGGAFEIMASHDTSICTSKQHKSIELVCYTATWSLLIALYFFLY